MILNVTQDMKNKVVKMPKSDIYEFGKELPNHIDDSEMIEYLSLDRNAIFEINKTASVKRLNVIRENKGSFDESTYFGNKSYNEELKFQVVFHSLAVDGERCIVVNGKDQVESYINEFFAVTVRDIYNDFALEMIQLNGLELMDETPPFYDAVKDDVAIVAGNSAEPVDAT